jgi:hypothetical protein
MSHLLTLLVAGVLATSAHAGLLDKYGTKKEPPPAPVVVPAPAPIPVPVPEAKPPVAQPAAVKPAPAPTPVPVPVTKAAETKAPSKPASKVTDVKPTPKPIAKKPEPKKVVVEKAEPKVVKADVKTSEPVKVARASSKSVDDQFAESSKSCDPGFMGTVCREKARWKLCDGRWSETPTDGQTACRQAPTQKAGG